MTESPWGPAQPAMEAALAREPSTIADVVDQLGRVQCALDKVPDLYGENPIADFNNLYLTITTEVGQRHRNGDFNDATFLNTLDVEFAKRYLDALRLYSLDPYAVPACWQVLFHRFNDASLRSLPCAVAGVNAHINFDLAFALVATWEQHGHNADGSRQHRDYLLINDVFAREIPALRRRYLAGWQRCIDRINGSFDDWYQNVLVEFTRARAWDQAQRLWLLRHDSTSFDIVRSTIDHQAARIGSMLLSPFCSFLQ